MWKKKAKTCHRLCWFLFVSVIGQRSIGDGCEWWLQTQILGIESKKDTPIYNIQARWETQADHCRKARRSLTELWGLHCKHPRKWVPICHLWLWLCNWRELPEKQNLFHCMVNFILFLESLFVFYLRFGFWLIWKAHLFLAWGTPLRPLTSTVTFHFRAS